MTDYPISDSTGYLIARTVSTDFLPTGDSAFSQGLVMYDVACLLLSDRMTHYNFGITEYSKVLAYSKFLASPDVINAFLEALSNPMYRWIHIRMKDSK